ncbi:ROK family protein [Anaeromassilibacillus sp. SJQ-1]|uniref:ROK family protein n=1 Tax=Anaeromassilibacillus sp. SJQ-1 TaxID=3375419 RepID=UPI003988CEF0
MPLYVLNDAKASAFAQLWFRWQEPAVQNMAYVLAGQGVGCGMVAGGKLVLGQRGIAGEFGHSSIKFDGPLCECGNRGCLEKYCSLSALRAEILRLLRTRRNSCLKDDDLSNASIAHAVQNGDPVAVQAYEKVCELLAAGVISLVNQLNPGLIVLGMNW